MKNLIIIFLAFISFQELNAQDFEFTLKQNMDSLNLWEFNFSKDDNDKEKIGTLILTRKQDVYSNDRDKKITPSITFDIYPIAMLDSISNFESERAMSISCCYPCCGATIKKTKNFVFWSNPWSIKAAFECDGMDYTRKNVQSIIEKVSEKNYSSIEDLIKDLTIERHE